MEAGMDRLERCMAELATRHEDVATSLEGLEEDVRASMEAFRAQLLEGQGTVILDFMEEVRVELGTLKRAISVGGPAPHEARRARVLDPKSFSGSRDAKEVDNFLWDLERYFCGARIDDE